MKLRVLILATITAAVAVGLAAQSGRGASTPEEREKAVRLVRELEADPLSNRAKENRQWLTVWLIAVPDIQVTLCTAFFPSLMESKKNHAAELAIQGPYSMAAFAIEHPEKANDDEAKYQAAVEGTLRAYESILRKDPKAHWVALDELIAKREKGELSGFVHETAPKCTAVGNLESK